MMVGVEWGRPPAHPTLADAEIAVWRLDQDAERPIETVLAAYLGVDPTAVTIRRSPAGRPELRGSPHRVSLSHGGDVALVGVAHGRDVGVDVEPYRPGIESWSLVRHALTRAEQARLSAEPSRRARDFLAIWTKKEAVLKALGVGLSLDPRLIELDGSSVASVPLDCGPARDWTLGTVQLPRHAAAFAVRGPVSRLRLYDARR